MVSLWYFVLFLLVLLLICTAYWYLTVPRNLPPGPKGLPFLGSVLETWNTSTLPDKLLEWKAKYGPLYKIYIADTLVLVLSDWNTLHEALVKQADTYSGRPTVSIVLPRELAGKGLINSEGELWKIQRRFALTTLRDFGFGRAVIEPHIKDEAEHLLEAIHCQNQNPFDPAILLQNAVANVICALVFGRRFEYDDQELHKMLRLMSARLNDTNFSTLTPMNVSDRWESILKIFPQVRFITQVSNELMDFFRTHIKETLNDFDLDKGDEPTNYIQAFYKAQKDEHNWTFNEDQLLGSVGNLFIAGTDTTATTLRWAIFFMAHHLDMQEQVYQEIKNQCGTQSLLNFADRTKLPFTEATIMESQRLANLVPVGVLRRTLAPSKLAGYDIPVGTVVVPFLTSALWDPAIYPNPEKFDPTRFLNGQKMGEKSPQLTHLIPFQAGKRVCLGESLARMELFILFTSLVSRYKFTFPLDEPKPPLRAPPGLLNAPPRFRVCAELRYD